MWMTYKLLGKWRICILSMKMFPVDGVGGRFGSAGETRARVVVAHALHGGGEHAGQHAEHASRRHRRNAPLN